VFRFLFGRGRNGAGAPRGDEAMKVILGLGNPGKEYERTRHNVGWWVVDHLADVWHFDGWKKDGEARVATGQVGAAKVRLVKPLTYMNLSGAVLRPYLRRPFWAAATDLFVVVDDVALPIGRYRVRAKGSAGGHNGLKSIEGAVQSQEYARLRIGIGPDDPRRRGDLADYVLDTAGKAEESTIRALLPTLTEAIELWIRDGVAPVMNRFTGEPAP
jgi:peptidyl-tRNA hydrolase, PTH1 family